MRLLTLALLLLCVDAHAQTTIYNTCGANTVSELEAGAIAFPNDDIVIEIDRSNSTHQSGPYVIGPVSGLDVSIALCRESPTPLSHCDYIDQAGAGAPEIVVGLGRERYFLLIEGNRRASPQATLSCGDVAFTVVPPLDG